MALGKSTAPVYFNDVTNLAEYTAGRSYVVRIDPGLDDPFELHATLVFADEYVSKGTVLPVENSLNEFQLALNLNAIGLIQLDYTWWAVDGTGVKRVDDTGTVTMTVKPPPPLTWDLDFSSGTVPVTLSRTSAEDTSDECFWEIIRAGQKALSFENYEFVLNQLCDVPMYALQAKASQSQAAEQGLWAKVTDLLGLRTLPFTDTEGYGHLKILTEAFVGSRAAVLAPDLFLFQGQNGTCADYLDNNLKEVPYLFAISRQLNLSFNGNGSGGEYQKWCEVISDRLSRPYLVELIWSYWQEQGMLYQTLGAISRRFQNVAAPGGRDPLAGLEIGPLRGLNNLIWGYIQDEQHRLSLVRRAYEYDHHYGLRLQGTAIPQMRTADSRSKFLEAFHNLLTLCSQFFRQDDDTTVIADGFPLLNALRDVHIILSMGAHNQFRDLPVTARIEMLMQQFMLARPEFREFLPRREMVAYPEAWMASVDSMKTLQGWTDVSVMHFNTLATHGEQIVLSIRYGHWTATNAVAAQAVNWARFWRSEIQGYIHAYRAVTGIDLSNDTVDTRQLGERYLQPSVHISRRMVAQSRQQPFSMNGAQPLPIPARAKAPVRR